MLVQSNQRTEGPRGHNWEQDAVARTVPFKHLALHQRLARATPEFLADLLLRLAKRQCFGLRKEVGEQNAVVLRVGDGVVRGCGGDEIGRNQLGSLVDELVERVLTVGTSRTPDDRLYRKQRQ